MTGRATSDALDALHGLLTDTLVEQIRTATRARDEHGNPMPVPSALLAQAIKFLKDNGIDSPAKARKVSDVLSKAMPNWSDEVHGTV